MAISQPNEPRCPLAALAARALICVGLTLILWISMPAPADAEPNPSDVDPFGGLSCSCSPTAPRGGPAMTQEIIRGIQQGLSAQEPAT